jgi:two-component system torCAD operon response regulator TorR
MSASYKTILLVDDEVVPRRRIGAILRNAGYGIIESRDYDEATATFQRRSEEIDMLLVDVCLPGNDGYKLAKAAIRMKPGAKVLLMSGSTGAEVCRFYGMPATDVHFLEKPFRAVDLLARVKYLLESAEPFTGTASA